MSNSKAALAKLTFGQPPSTKWAYDLVRRWDSGDHEERKFITPWPLQLAREVCKADQFGRIEEMSDG